MANYNTLLERFNEQPVQLNMGAAPQGGNSAAAHQPPAPPQAALVSQPVQHQSSAQLVEATYPVESVQTSNNHVINAQFSHETISMQAFQKLCPRSVQLFSDGIYRLVKESNGIVSHVPALVSGN